MAEKYQGEFYCVKCKAKRETEEEHRKVVELSGGELLE